MDYQFLAGATAIAATAVVFIGLEWSGTFSTNFRTCRTRRSKSPWSLHWQAWAFGITLAAAVVLVAIVLGAGATEAGRVLLEDYDDSWWVSALWKMSHFALAFIVGVLAPCFWKEMVAAQTVWEIFECSGVGDYLFGTVEEGCALSNQGCGSWSDIGFNTMGLVAGLIVYRLAVHPRLQGWQGWRRGPGLRW